MNYLSVKRIFFLIIVIGIILFPFAVYASEDDESSVEVGEILSEYIDMYSDEIENSAYDVDELKEILPDFSVNELLSSSASGNLKLNIETIISNLLNFLFKEVYSSFKLLLTVLSISLLCSYVVNLSCGIGDEISKTAFYVCYMIISGISVASFTELADYGQTAVENMSVFMHTIVPLILTALVSGGALISAATLEPMLIFSIESSVLLIQNFFMPLLITSTAIRIVNNLSDKIKVTKLVNLIDKTIKWGLGICMTIFVGISGLQSISSGTASGMSVKISKFAASNLIPVVGGILSDSIETIMNCSSVIKNSLGVVGILTLVLISLIPLVKIGASLIIFRLFAALAEPISDIRIVKCINGLADCISIMFSMVASVAVMFIIILTIVINAGNIAIMMGK